MLKHLPLAILCAFFAADKCAAAEAPSVTRIRAGKYRYIVSTNCPEHRTQVGSTVKLGIVVDSALKASLCFRLVPLIPLSA